MGCPIHILFYFGVALLTCWRLTSSYHSLPLCLAQRSRQETASRPVVATFLATEGPLRTTLFVEIQCVGGKHYPFYSVYGEWCPRLTSEPLNERAPKSSSRFFTLDIIPNPGLIGQKIHKRKLGRPRRAINTILAFTYTIRSQGGRVNWGFRKFALWLRLRRLTVCCVEGACLFENTRANAGDKEWIFLRDVCS